MEAYKIEIKTLTISLVAVAAVEIAVRFMIQRGQTDPIIILGMARLAETLLLLIIVRSRGRGLSSVGLSVPGMVPGLKRGLAWSAGLGMVSLLAIAVMFAMRVDPLAFIRTRLPARGVDIVLFFAAGALAGPVAEEVLFRGILYGFFRRWGVLLAVCTSTVLFVLAHPSAFHRIPLTQVAGGVIFAVAYEKEGNLMVPITIHVLGNMAIFALSLV